MRLRAIICEDHPAVREVLRLLCERRGYEVFAFAHPGLCPLHTIGQCPCGPGGACADLILSDLQMPEVDGIEFVEVLLAKRCVAPHIALMSGGWTDTGRARAVGLGCRLFTKPFDMMELLAWFDWVETQVAPTRVLVAWATLEEARSGGNPGKDSPDKTARRLMGPSL
jgi:DNA-binding response OmpR family regulator